MCLWRMDVNSLFIALIDMKYFTVIFQINVFEIFCCSVFLSLVL